LILNVYYGKANYNLQYDRTHDMRAASYLSGCFGDRRSLPEIITRDLWSFLGNKWTALVTKFIRQDVSLLKHRTVAELMIVVFSSLGQGGVSLYIIINCLRHIADHSVGQIMMYFQAFSGGVGALARVMQQISGIYEGSCFLQTYQQFFEVQKTPTPITKKPRKVPDVIESIECCNLGFMYPGASVHALTNINLIFRQSQSTMLVGRNGAGKTTLARLLVGLYSPTEGRILINGHDMREYDLSLLRKKMTIIFQDFVRYALTVEENIGLGSVEHMEDHERIVSAAKAARLDDIIAGLPNGYSTILGKEFRNGRDLSLGEWQRVCLARLFMRDASIMLYDEPSASLDVETESEVLREIRLSGKDKICILVSHRMLRADIADRIIVLETGVIVENGSHEELLALHGKYAHLWNAYHRLKAPGK
jgi:ATP-binding cassette subfamily B protein